MYKMIFQIIGFLCTVMLATSYALGEELITDQDLFSEPKAQSVLTAKAKKGQISILEKKGFWVKIKSGDSSGWTKLSNIKTSFAGNIDLPDTGRSSDGNIVSTSGVRGLDGVDLINAKPDLAEFEKFMSSKTTKEQGVNYAKVGGLKTRTVAYIVPVTK